ncbi:MAG: hypothetical protein F4Y86_02825 [Gammaproteobacteria bacterium]|nr:hypothetical protein [Gammaproteobacteria bacterium]MYB39180.1 hypothetical protein [Gammaproteobacteria bacterium]
MGCRVGTSKTPYERIEYWKEEEDHDDGYVLHSALTYDQAQDKEKEEGDERGCYYKLGGDPGSDRDEPIWSVYIVSGGTAPGD